MTENTDKFSSQENKEEVQRVIYVADRRKNASLSVIKPAKGFVERRQNMGETPVISMADKIEKQSRKKHTTLHMQKVAQYHRMSIGKQAYERYVNYQKFMRMRQMRSFLLSFILTSLLLIISGFISYKFTSAWFTNKPITLSTFIDPDLFAKSKLFVSKNGKSSTKKVKKNQIIE